MFRKKTLLIISGVFFVSLLSFFSCESTKESALVSYQQPDITEYSATEISFIKSIVDTITEEELWEYIRTLQNFGTRYAPSEGNLKAAHYLKKTFQSFGIKDVKFDEFSYYNDLTKTYDSSRNVVASKQGLKKPEKIVVIGAHFDTICRRAPDGRVSALDNENPAPGADDNGTGVATVLAAARVLNPYEFDHTIRFIAFSAEEGGLYGSSHYAAKAAKKGEDIIAMINIDMIGYKDQEPEDMDIFANTQSIWLLDSLVNKAAVYAPGLLIYRIINDTYDGTDHGPFWYNGYPAVCFMEDYYPSNRLYHTPADTIDTVDFPFSLKSVKLVVGTSAELAGIHITSESLDTQTDDSEALSQKAINWQKDAGQKFLFTILPYQNQVEIIDISFPHVHSKESIVLEEIIPDTWGRYCYHPIAACKKPSDHFIYIPMIRLRAPGKESENGIIKIVNAKKSEIVNSFEIGTYPTRGSFNADGSKYYQPYWGEKFIDVFDTTSLQRIDRIDAPIPINKFVVDTEEKQGIGISPETNSIVIINLSDKKVEKVMKEISVPRDIVMLNWKNVLVCSYDQAKLYQIDLDEKTIVAEFSMSPRPQRLILSPQKDKVISIHYLSTMLNLFSIKINDGKLTVDKSKEMDMGESIIDGSFADDNRVYFISSSKYRLFGYNLTNREVFWGMRTGGVRARGGVEEIIFIGN
jgi:hypothetical protein